MHYPVYILYVKDTHKFFGMELSEKEARQAVEDWADHVKLGYTVGRVDTVPELNRLMQYYRREKHDVI